jgi:hypothetical protein
MNATVSDPKATSMPFRITVLRQLAVIEASGAL